MISHAEKNGSQSTPVPDDFEELTKLLAVLSEATNRFESLAAEANEEFLETLDGHTTEYAKLQDTIGKAEEALEVIARRHPEWFREKKTVKTPYGSVSLKNNPPKLEVKSEEWTIDLIQKAGDDAKSRFLRERTELNLDALGELPDEELHKFRIVRTQGDHFEAKPAKIDLGSALKAAAKSAEKAVKKPRVATEAK